MIVLVSVTLFWSAFALNFAKSSFKIPSVIMRALEPVRGWLTSPEIEADHLTESCYDRNNARSQLESDSQFSFQILIVIQVLDKLLGALFLILSICLHN